MIWVHLHLLIPKSERSATKEFPCRHGLMLVGITIDAMENIGQLKLMNRCPRLSGDAQ
jgi:hypothetical protein